LFAVETLEPEIVDRLPGFKRRMQWFIDNHPDMPKHIETTQRSARGVRRLLSLVSRRQLKRVLERMLESRNSCRRMGCARYRDFTQSTRTKSR